ncbi:MAG: hypothetical protein AABY01_04310, partial [Nanoarchaeota archaeon]
MDPRIKEDILSVLKKAIEALKSGNFIVLDELSNHTIHDASIYQDEDSTSTAILMYTISKVMQRCSENACPAPMMLPLLTKAQNALELNKEGMFHASYTEAFDLLTKHDE